MPKAALPKRPDWSRPLPQAVIPNAITLNTLADLRELIGHLPKEFRSKATWQSVIGHLNAAARGADSADVSVALQLVLMLERVTFRRKWNFGQPPEFLRAMFDVGHFPPNTPPE